MVKWFKVVINSFLEFERVLHEVNMVTNLATQKNFREYTKAMASYYPRKKRRYFLKTVIYFAEHGYGSNQSLSLSIKHMRFV